MIVYFNEKTKNTYLLELSDQSHKQNQQSSSCFQTSIDIVKMESVKSRILIMRDALVVGIQGMHLLWYISLKRKCLKKICIGCMSSSAIQSFALISIKISHFEK